MINLLITISVAFSAFIATNLDDIFILMVFFAHPHYNSSSIILGQYVGIICLILICIPAYFLKSFIPPILLALMGLIPLFLGLKQLYSLNKKNYGESLLSEREKISEKVDESKLEENKGRYSKFAWITIASVTIANGADNIGVYIPLFTNLTQIELLITITTFLIMTGLWCLCGRFIIKNMRLGNRIKQYGHIILPFVLIILGIGIFITNLFKM